MIEETELYNIKKLKEYIDTSTNIVFFGGAGCSTESGIPDFRSAKGIYTNNRSAEEIVSHSYFFQNPERFYRFYKDKMMFLDAKPNACHQYFAKLQETKNVTIVTQNIDGLHQLEGSLKVYELHGSIHRNYCLKCGKFFDANYVYDFKGVPYCDKCGGIIKPDVVLYEEPLDEEVIYGAIKAIENADLLIVGGTSLNVYPAAGFIRYYHGVKLVNINLDDNHLTNCLNIKAPIAEVFKKITEDTK